MGLVTAAHETIEGAGYHKTPEVRMRAESLGITLYDLPPYSPNLNPIDRVWKIMNERVQNNI